MTDPAEGFRRGEGARPVLEAWDRALQAVRSRFRGEGFLEVLTPVACPHPNLDPGIRPVPADIRDFSGRPRRSWLHTSPEPAMKKLLSRGSGSIFQVAPVFRDGELTERHRPEFTMLEWYRVGGRLADAMRDTRETLAGAARAVRGDGRVSWRGKDYDLGGSWEEITVRQAFRRFAGVVDLSREGLAEALKERKEGFPPDETREGLFFRLYVREVETRFGEDRPAMVTGFPAFLGTMAAPSPGDPTTLQRFEAFVGGLELANGYVELTDPVEQARRLEETRIALEREGAVGLTVDPEFLEAVGKLPPCAGVSVGLDRLMMLLLGAEDIAQVRAL